MMLGADMIDKELSWYKEAVFYEVYIRAFKDGNGDGHGDLIGLTHRSWIILRI